jgi:hypothetical protein
MSVIDLGTTAGSRIGRYLSLVSVLPSAVLVLFVVLLASSGAWSGSPNWSRAIDTIAHPGIGSAFALSTVALILGLGLHPLQFALVQLYEGYWGSSEVARRLAFMRATRYWEMIRYLREEQAQLGRSLDPKDLIGLIRATATINEMERIIASFPPNAEEFLPTRLGNVLRHYERQAGKPFRLNVLTVLPSLVQASPERDVAYLNDQRSSLDLAVRLSMTSLLATAAALLFLWDDELWLLIALVPYGFAYLSYRGALVAAHEYGTAIVSLFALNRHVLYERLGLARPEDTGAERDQNLEVDALYKFDEDTDLEYDKPSELVQLYVGHTTMPASNPEPKNKGAVSSSRARVRSALLRLWRRVLG